MNHQELSAWLSSKVGRSGSDGAGDLQEALLRFREPGMASDLICSALQDEQWADTVLSGSYRHPNGFDKLVLMSTERFQLRLHVWRENPCESGSGDDGEAENIHNHRWDFSSVILLGGYRYQEFIPNDGGTPFHTYAYGSQRGAASYSLEPLGRRPLTCCFDAFLPAGTSYTLTSDVYHRVVNTSGALTASLVLQGPHRPTSVLVFADRRLREGEPLPLARFTRATLRHRLHDLVTALEGAEQLR